MRIDKTSKSSINRISPEKKRVCFVIPSLQAGGMERVMSELLWYFSDKNDIEVNLVLYGITRDVFYRIPDHIEIHKPGFTFSNRRRFLDTIRTLIFLRRIIKKLKPESVLSFGEYWNNFVLLATVGIRTPIFVSDRSQPDKSLGKFHDFLRNLLYRRAKGIILQTGKARDIYLSLRSHQNVTVIGNPIRSIREDDGIIHKNKRVLMVGRLIKTKHQDRLIKMFAEVAPPDWKLSLVGYDHMKQNHMDNLKKMAKDLNIEDQVEFMGKQAGIEKIYLESSVFAFTSSSEGFPNAIGEAMSAGLPVIAYDCNAGPSEMIEDGKNGFLIPLFDDVEFARKLKLLIEDDDLRVRLGNQAREDIRFFSIENTGKRFMDYILTN